MHSRVLQASARPRDRAGAVDALGRHRPAPQDRTPPGPLRPPAPGLLALPRARPAMKYYCAVARPRYSRYARRTVHFPNDIVFQDHVRQGDLEQVGRFIRAGKVSLDTIYPSGESRARRGAGGKGAARR